ncbi:cilia and flagella associated protein 410 isoform X2 [Labrus bergylta]|uniref:cilia and flagella associated protein 410 isoform X2 n=1 Tax=Labrus bergylta TaxID=56723 RepID=UPI0033133AFC
MKLTRKLVLAKAKASDLESVKKLNCWGCNLTDISIFSQMPNIEVLALRVLWLAENPCCGSDCSQYRLTVLRCLPHLQKLDNQVVTEDELAVALKEGEVVTTPPSSIQNQLSTNGLPDAETENDPLNYNMEETNKIREELGMKPLSRDKFPSLSSPSTREIKPSLKKTHTLDAVLLLLRDLDEEELRIVNTVTENRLQTYTLDSETLDSTQQTQKTADIQH